MDVQRPLEYTYQATKSLLLSDFKKPAGKTLINNLKTTINLANQKRSFREIDYNPRYKLAYSTDNSFQFFLLDPYDGIILSVLNSYYEMICQGAKPISFTTGINEYIDDKNNEINAFQISEFKKSIDFIKSTLGLQMASDEDKQLIESENLITVCFGAKDKLGPYNNPKNLKAGDYILLFGKTEPEFDGSTWAETKKTIKLGGLPPALRDDKIAKTVSLIRAVSMYNNDVNIFSVGPGGIAASLYNISKQCNISLKVDLSKLFIDNMTLFDILLSESSNRFMATMNKSLLKDLNIICSNFDIEYNVIGIVPENIVSEDIVSEQNVAQVNPNIEINGLGILDID
jgi:phosphoribosylformylglycinamidine (FGAM) synthase-like enzyme